ncbi:glycoside hydrolase family 95 protein [Parabacteroides sp. 52]|uniref:glycoside hydrolase family 95 protein n=1 Tax=unclassified Parabacteroides TaxID=2649774 RepID=UPI0013D6FA0F|nr:MULTISPECIES: glycoside hydrolase family 95 protein [unclassified Parabacteroides]NDV54623.1 glycoside hydrolase family 95 protein [Parabacteroides sp. 52]
MKFQLFLFLHLFLLLSCQPREKKKELTLWYNQPAANWDEALPIGNGHAGAMVFGGAEKEQLSLNENTLYSGEPADVFKEVKVTPETFERVVDLLKKKEYVAANEIVCKNWLGRLHQYYQPLGDLFITNNKEGEITAYKRDLNLSQAIANTEFTQNGIKYKREVFASNPDNVIVMRITSDRADGIDISLQFTSPHPTARQEVQDNLLVLQGQAPGYVERRTFEQIEAWGDQYKHPELYDKEGNRKFDKRVLYGEEIENKGMLFEAQLKPVFPGKGEYETTESGLRIYNTQEVYLVMALATSFNGYDKSPSREGIDPAVKATEILSKAETRSYPKLKERHTKDYKELFDRVSLTLPSEEEQLKKPTDERITQFAQQADPDLAALLYQFGRYLMISGSRPGGQPLNLQGLWNKDVTPPWNSGYTMNINTEMNYWMAEPTQLAECHEPLFHLIKELSVTGAETARTMYNRRGWVGHHNTSIWRESLPNDNVPTASFWPMVQGWLSSHLWEHYLYTGDKEFLQKEAYPILKGAAAFYADWLIDDGEGHLVTPAGISPENTFLTEKGERAALSMGPTMDMAIIKETFSRTIQASVILDRDKDLREELEEKLSLLLPYRIGKRGQLQEWMYDFEESDPRHRHLSHLYGFHPGDQITADKTPELFKAVEKTLNLRGDEASGWSMGWKINFWARMQDGNRAYKIITNLFNPVGFGEQKRRGGGLYRNMFDAHPPFQIDGNFGFTAGVTEMLMQSHAGFIQLLPALPDVWATGEITGLKARGNFEIHMRWQHNQLEEATLRSLAGEKCIVRTQLPVIVKKKGQIIARSSPVESMDKTFHEVNFNTEKGSTYLISNEEK